MDADAAMRLMLDMLLTAAKVGGPVLMAVLVVGVLISIVQVVTQVQEMTLTFVPKLIALFLIFLLLGGWMLSTVVEFTRRMILSAGGLGP